MFHLRVWTSFQLLIGNIICFLYHHLYEIRNSLWVSLFLFQSLTKREMPKNKILETYNNKTYLQSQAFQAIVQLFVQCWQYALQHLCHHLNIQQLKIFCCFRSAIQMIFQMFLLVVALTFFLLELNLYEDFPSSLLMLVFSPYVRIGHH